MTTLRVPDMHCEKCVARIYNALNGAGLKFCVSMEDYSVTVDGSAADVERARAELDDIGFTAE